MGTWRSDATFEGEPRRLLAALTEVEAIEHWSPVRFHLDDGVQCLRAGEEVAVEGALLGRGVRFRVEVAQADEEGLSLHARGPFEIDVDYSIEPESCTVSARVATRGGGPKAKLLASAANAMLAAGALDHALRRLVRHATSTPMAAAP